jgi:hypothetical protein
MGRATARGPASIARVTRRHAVVALLVAAAVLAIDVLRAPQKDKSAAGMAGVHVDDNGLHDDEDACEHGADAADDDAADDDAADDAEQGATGDAAR